jgi:hypothetical protein
MREIHSKFASLPLPDLEHSLDVHPAKCMDQDASEQLSLATGNAPCAVAPNEQLLFYYQSIQESRLTTYADRVTKLDTHMASALCEAEKHLIGVECRGCLSSYASEQVFKVAIFLA